MDSRSVFEKNLAAIRKRSPLLEQALKSASRDGIEGVEGPRGAQVLRENGVLLGSMYDPVREGEQLADTMAEQPADIMVAIGFGLGEQFEPYCQKNPATVIVYEPSLARMRAALERISIVNLFAKESDFYLATDAEQFSNILNARYVPGLRLRVFPHPAILRLDASSVGRMVERVRFIKDATDTRTLTSIEMLAPWAKLVAANGSAIASTPDFGCLKRRFAGKPAVIVAAGPSLDKQLPLLREMQDRIVIIAIGQTVKALRAAGIEPDMVHVLESRDVSHQLTDAGETESLCVTYAPDCHPNLFQVPTRARFVAVPNASPLGRWIRESTGQSVFTLGGGTVAQGAVGLAVTMGANPIMLIGQDLAFTEGRAYAASSVYDFIEVELREDGTTVHQNMKKKVGLLGDLDVDTIEDTGRATKTIWVDAWEPGERVATSRSYAAFIEQYRDIGQQLSRAGIELINCTEGGARLNGLVHQTFREALEEHARSDFDARSSVLEAHDEAPVYSASDYAVPIAEARKTLTLIEKEIRKALSFSERKRRGKVIGKNEQQRMEVMRGYARHEKRIKRRLEGVPWLDALVQAEIYNAIAATRRTERLEPSFEDLLDESDYLFRAACKGVERARDWLTLFEASFDRDQSEGVLAELQRIESLRLKVASDAASGKSVQSVGAIPVAP